MPSCWMRAASATRQRVGPWSSRGAGDPHSGVRTTSAELKTMLIDSAMPCSRVSAFFSDRVGSHRPSRATDRVRASSPARSGMAATSSCALQKTDRRGPQRTEAIVEVDFEDLVAQVDQTRDCCVDRSTTETPGCLEVDSWTPQCADAVSGGSGRHETCSRPRELLRHQERGQRHGPSG